MYQVRVTTRDEYDDMPHCQKVISGYGRQARECRAMADFRVEYQLPGAPDGVANWICRDHVGIRLAELALKLPVDTRTCESGCGCRYGTTDPDVHDCACDGPCSMAEPQDWGCDPSLGGCGGDCPTCPVTRTDTDQEKQQ